MNLKDYLPKVPLLTKDQEKREYFFALNIDSNEVEASVWGIEGKTLQIINIARSSYSTEEELIQSANMALDEALGAFEPEPTKILFGVPGSWLQDDNLKEVESSLLKKMVKELDVNPMAYVSVTHALTHLLQKISGIPATTILVGINDPLVVTVVKAGKIIGTKAAKRGNNLAEDVEKILAGFSGVEVLPSKISLYGTRGDLDKLRDELTSYNWMSNLPFLHLPKVEVLEDDIPIKAISLAGASEVLPDVTYSPQKVNTQEVDKSLSNISPIVNSDFSPKHEAKGFITGDIAEKEVIEERPLPERVGKEMMAVEGMVGSLKDRLMAPLATVKEQGLRFPRSPMALIKNKSTFIPLLAVLLLILAYLFLPRATVTIFVDPKVLEKDAQVVADPKATAVDEANKIIPGKIVETDISGSGKGSATGKKQIGNAAKGTVTIYNNQTNTSVHLSQGTTLADSAGHKFSLDSPADATSSATTTDSNFNTITTPGKASNIGMTAAAIGPDSNLSGGTKLTVSSYSQSQVFAVVDQGGISGGTSQDVTVVTTDDQKRLLAQVSSDLRNQAKDKLQSKLTGDQKILPEALQEKINSTSYSKSVNDQASEFSLNLSVHYTGTAYSDNDLKQMVSQLVQTNVPDGYELNLADTTTQADVSKLEPDGKLIFLARFSAKLLPKLDLGRIKEQIKGQPTSKVEDILKGNDNVIGSDISIHPSLPGPLQRLPFFTQNISVSVTAK